MIILASGSPRRKQLLKKLTEDFVVVPSTCAEVTTAALPRLAARELACHKAVDVFTHTDCGKQSGAVVIGCDTVVDLDGEVLGKPKTADEAAEMLRSLSGRTHLVHTGYAVVSQGFVDVGVETTQVTFRKLTDEDVAAYGQGRGLRHTGNGLCFGCCRQLRQRNRLSDGTDKSAVDCLRRSFAEVRFVRCKTGVLASACCHRQPRNVFHCSLRGCPPGVHLVTKKSQRIKNFVNFQDTKER